MPFSSDDLTKDSENVAQNSEKLGKAAENLANGSVEENLANGSVEETNHEFTKPEYYCSKCGFPVCNEKCKIFCLTFTFRPEPGRHT